MSFLKRDQQIFALALHNCTGKTDFKWKVQKRKKNFNRERSRQPERVNARPNTVKTFSRTKMDSMQRFKFALDRNIGNFDNSIAFVCYYQLLR